MSFKDGRDYLYLIWKDPICRRQYIVGQLSKNGTYLFNYGFEVKDAIQNGFQLLIAFPCQFETYESEFLFPAFSSRLPDKRRKDIMEILNKYSLNEYDEYKLLKRSGASLPIDNLYFIDPIIDFNDTNIVRSFYLAGTRHYLGCEKSDCYLADNVDLGEQLTLQKEEDNIYDKYAIKVLSSSGKHIGYIPRYYNKELYKLFNLDYSFTCYVKKVNKKQNCNECILVDFNANSNCI